MNSKHFYEKTLWIFYILLFSIIAINFLDSWNLSLVFIILALITILNKSYIDKRLENKEEDKLDTIIGLLREMKHLNRAPIKTDEIEDIKRKFSAALGSLDDRIRNLENQ